MIPLIENQIHQYLVDQEEARCKALEAEYSKFDNTRRKKVTRKAIPKPWKRSNEYSLCQNIELLLLIDKFDYDLSNRAFQDFCLSVGVLHVAGKPKSKRWSYFQSFAKSKDEFLCDPYFQFAEEFEGQSHRYSEDEMEIGWKTIKLGRARLQDCWEIYSRNVAR